MATTLQTVWNYCSNSAMELLLLQRVCNNHNCSLLSLFDFKHTCDSCSFHPFPWPHNCFLCRAGTRCPCGVEDAVVTSGSSRGRGEQRVGGVWGVVWLSAQDPGEMIIWRWSRLPTAVTITTLSCSPAVASITSGWPTAPPSTNYIHPHAHSSTPSP